MSRPPPSRPLAAAPPWSPAEQGPPVRPIAWKPLQPSWPCSAAGSRQRQACGPKRRLPPHDRPAQVPAPPVRESSQDKRCCRSAAGPPRVRGEPAAPPAWRPPCRPFDSSTPAPPATAESAAPPRRAAVHWPAPRPRAARAASSRRARSTAKPRAPSAPDHRSPRSPAAPRRSPAPCRRDASCSRAPARPRAGPHPCRPHAARQARRRPPRQTGCAPGLWPGRAGAQAPSCPGTARLSWACSSSTSRPHRPMRPPPSSSRRQPPHSLQIGSTVTTRPPARWE